jgi:Rv0078B-related antitoxin
MLERIFGGIVCMVASLMPASWNQIVRWLKEIDAVRQSGLPGSRLKPYSSAMEAVAQAFRATLDLFQTGVDLMRQSLRRRHSEATEEDIERLLQAWLLERPGAEAGDCPGRRVDPRLRFA